MRPLRSGWLGDASLLVAALVVVSGAGRAWDLGRRSPGMDFYQFWVVAQVAGRPDVSSIYDEGERARIGREFVRRAHTEEDSERRRLVAERWLVLRPTATPFFYAVFRSFSGGSYESDFHRYRLISLTCGLAGLLALSLLLRFPPLTAMLVLGLVLYAFEPLRSDIRVGNVNQIQLAVLAGYLWLGHRPDRSILQVSAGFVLGAAVLFKPNLLGIVPLVTVSWCFHRRWDRLARQAAGLVAGAAVAVSAGALALGRLGAWGEWLAFVRELPLPEMNLLSGNFGFDRVVREKAGLTAGPLWAVVAFAATLACIWLGRPRRLTHGPGAATAEVLYRTRDFALVAAGCLIYLLSAPMVWLHYFLLTLPAALFLLRDGPTPGKNGSGAGRRILAGAALGSMAIDPYADLLQIRDLGRQAMVASAGLILLFALTLREILAVLASAPPVSNRAGSPLSSTAEDGGDGDGGPGREPDAGAAISRQ